MHIPRVSLVSRDNGSASSSTDSGPGSPNLGLILGVTVSVVVIIIAVLLIVWRIVVVKRRQEAAVESSTNIESLSRPPEKFTSNTLRGFKFPHKSEPAPHPRIDPYVLPQPPAPTVVVASASADSFGNTASSEYHYKTWRTVASSRSIDDPHMFTERTSQTSPRMQARDGLHSTGEMKDLITMFNSQRVDSAGAPPPVHAQTLSPSLAVKPMRPISVASTLVAPHTVSKDFGSLSHGLKRTHSVERTSDGYNSDATVPSVMRRPKFNPREGAPVIPSIYFQPFELDNDPSTFLARSNSMDSRRTSATVGGPHRVPSQLGRTSTSRQNYPHSTTRKRQNSEPPKIPALPRLATIADGAQGTFAHTDSTIPPLPLTRSFAAPRASVAPSVSEYPESRAGSIYIDPDMPLSHAPLSPTVVPSRNNSARSGWI